MGRNHEQQETNWWEVKDAQRLISMSFLTFTFMILELFYGIHAGSLALISDSFHMMSDLIALAVGVGAIIGTIQKNTSLQKTYFSLKTHSHSLQKNN